MRVCWQICGLALTLGLPIGVNLPPVGPSYPCVFTDLFRQAGPFYANHIDDGTYRSDPGVHFNDGTVGLLTLNERGYPTSLPDRDGPVAATSVILDFADGVCGQTGSFEVTWEGSGEVAISGVESTCEASRCVLLLTTAAMQLRLHVLSLPVTDIHVVSEGSTPDLGFQCCLFRWGLGAPSRLVVVRLLLVAVWCPFLTRDILY